MGRPCGGEGFLKHIPGRVEFTDPIGKGHQQPSKGTCSSPDGWGCCRCPLMVALQALVL